MNKALYPGSFDPITYGHLDLIRRGAKTFDQLVVAVARNTGKKSIFSPDERVEIIVSLTQEFSNVEVTQFEGMTVEFARRNGCGVILRGLRTMADFEYESQLAFINRTLAPDVETVLMMSSQEYTFVSSKWIKEAVIFGADVSRFVPDSVAKQLKKRTGK
ncbi:MAG: pantetheine-phosphate adenylyltransferase [Planctomycetota bacterium]|nr:pantetheine-phosphate adenylyltransferase [Planctomycetota bacterium]MDA1137194.1 pantetheine-phosphate adenylyltransferase [Planctomycetota bacterium]